MAANLALGHSSLVSSEPADGSTVSASPQVIYLRFNEPVTLVRAHLIGPDGSTRHDFDANASGPDVMLRPRRELPSGTSTVTYRVVSADGHPLGGSVIFSIGAGSKAQDARGLEDPSRRAAIWLARSVAYLSLLFGVGGSVFLAIIFPEAGRRRSHRTHFIMWLAPGVIAIPCGLGLQGLDVLDQPWSSLIHFGTWATAANSHGITSALGLGALLLAGTAVLLAGSRHGAVWAASAMVLVALAFASTGHASTAEPRWLTRTIVGLHTAAAAVWAGSLPHLLHLALDRDPGLSQALTRFSRKAFPAVVILIAAGAVLSLVQLGTIKVLTNTEYGSILAYKLVCVAILLALAAFNRFSLTGAIASRSVRAVRHLQFTILAEIALLALVVCLVAAWRFTPPPRAAQAHSPIQMHIHGERAMVQITFEPGRTGPNKAALRFLASDFTAITPKEVAISVSLPSGDVEPREVKAVLGSDETWTASDLHIPVEGLWRVQVDALITEFEKVSLTGELVFKR